MTKVVGYMYNVLGRNVVLQQKTMHPVAKFLSKTEFEKERERNWTTNHLIHEGIRDLIGNIQDIYYIKSNYKN